MSIYAFDRQICAASVLSSCSKWLTFLSLIISIFFLHSLYQMNKNEIPETKKILNMFLISCSLKDFYSLGSLCIKILTVFLTAITCPLFRFLRWIGDFRFNYIYIHTYFPCRSAFISRLVTGDISICVYAATLFCLTFFSQVYR